MAVDPGLRDRLIKELDVSGSQVDRKITERARALVLPREQAAIALALEVGVSISRFATSEDLAEIRGAAARSAPQPAVAAPPTTTPTRSSGRRTSRSPTRRAAKRKGTKVAVVHGRDTERRKAIFQFLRAIGLDPIEWTAAVKSTGKAAPYVGEVLDQLFKEAVAVVVLITPDDQARLRKALRRASDPAYEARLTGQARPNVLFEAGMAFGSHPDSTVLVEVGAVRPFSDIGGRHVVRLTDRAESRQDLANRLEAAGCDIDLSGTDWLTEGKFGT